MSGGIGNQMFQYAAGRALAHINGVALKLDVTSFGRTRGNATQRQYALGAFDIAGVFAAPEEIERLKDGEGKLVRLAKLLAGRRSRVREKHYHFDPEVLKFRGDAYLDGYWQSERYFVDIEDIIRREFTIRVEPDELNRKMAETIGGMESVSIHFRRGDYVSNPVVSRAIGTLPLEYYSAAVERLRAHVAHPHFFVFSDDVPWVKENLRIGCPVTFVDHNGPDKAYEDLRLMSSCRHHIIANSSFGWWGAWLAKNPAKTVIAPLKWFARKDVDTRDLIPEKWIRI